MKSQNRWLHHSYMTKFNRSEIPINKKRKKNWTSTIKISATQNFNFIYLSFCFVLCWGGGGGNGNMWAQTCGVWNLMENLRRRAVRSTRTAIPERGEVAIVFNDITLLCSSVQNQRDQNSQLDLSDMKSCRERNSVQDIRRTEGCFRFSSFALLELVWIGYF